MNIKDKINTNASLLRFVHDRKHGVGKLIMSSSPSTRFDGSDIDGLREDDLPALTKYLQVLQWCRLQWDLVFVALQ